MFKNIDSYNESILSFMQKFTIAGAGGFGLIHLLMPGLLGDLLGAPENSLMLGDMFVASVFLAFAIAAVCTLGSLKSYATIAAFQGTYKGLWCLFFIVHFGMGNIDISLFNSVYFAIMATFVVGDYLALK